MPAMCRIRAQHCFPPSCSTAHITVTASHLSCSIVDYTAQMWMMALTATCPAPSPLCLISCGCPGICSLSTHPPPCLCRYLLDFLAERKSYSDLSSSIIDGRYTAQKWMMAGQDSVRTCFYIMEGNPADLNAYGQATSSKQQACVTALHRMLLHDGFKVMETGGPQDTVDLLACITK